MIDKSASSGFVDFNDSPWFKQSFPFYSPPEEEKWRSLLHSRALLLRYVRRFCCCCCCSSSFLSWSLEVSLKIVQNLHGHDVTIQTTQKKKFCMVKFFSYSRFDRKIKTKFEFSSELSLTLLLFFSL